MTTTGGAPFLTSFNEVVDLSNRTKLCDILGDKAGAMISMHELDFDRRMNPDKPFSRTKDELLIANWVLQTRLIEVESAAVGDGWSDETAWAVIWHLLTTYLHLQIAPHWPFIPESLRETAR